MHRRVKRGIALAALAPLALTMAPAAHADSIATQVGAGDVVLYSQFNATKVATVKNDGTDATVHLEAGAGTGIGAVTFQYSVGGGAFVDITTVSSRNADGTFAFEWTPPASLIGATVTLRVTTGGATPINDDVTGVQIQPGGGAAEAVNIADGSALGVFQAPYAAPNNGQYVAVTGTTSATAGNVALTRRDGDGAAVAAAVNAPVTLATPDATTGVFAGALDIAPYTYDPAPSNPVNQLVVGAELGSDDTEAFTLYRQQITTVTATPKSTTVTSGSTTDVVVKVTDQDGKPVAGARVTSTGTGNPAGFTDAKGEVTLTQGAGTAYYYADATAAAGYSATDGDKRSDDVVITSYNAVPTALQGKSADGPAFDFDENAASDITVQIVDQQGQPVGPGLLQTVQYYWVNTPFDGSAVVRTPATGNSTATPNASGVATIPLPASPKSGTFELHAALTNAALGGNGIPEATVLTVKAGDSTLAFDDASPLQAPAGTTVPVAGSLELADGTALAGRNVDLTYVRGTESGTTPTPDSGLVQANGTVALTLTVKTGADGAFTASVKDPAETPQPTEVTNTLAAATANTPGIGNANEQADTNAVTAGAQPLTIDFLASVAPNTATISDATPLIGGKASPGRPVNGTVMVKSADGTALANQSVTLTTSAGYFTTYAATAAALVPDPAAANGADAGSYKNEGTTITVKTDATGAAKFTLAINRDTGFDDDGKVTAAVQATVGSVNASKGYEFSSADPYNGGAVALELSPAAQQDSAALPKAPLTDRVYYEVLVTDQFGNAVAGESVDITDDTAGAAVSGATVTSNLTKNGDFYATASAPVNQAITATWTTEKNTFTVTPGTPPTVTVTPGTETLSDSDVVNWYEADLAASTYTLERTPADPVAVGSTVTETYTVVDQNGEPVPSVFVQFFRTGAGANNGGESTFSGLTGEDGKISYVFQATAAGQVQIQVVARDGSASGDVIEEGAKSDTITVGEPAPTQQTIKVKLVGKNLKKGKVDQLIVRGPNVAKGATVTLYKIVKGKAVKLKTAKLNNLGDKTFKVRDANVKAITQYAVLVKATPRTKQAVSNVVKLK